MGERGGETGKTLLLVERYLLEGTISPHRDLSSSHTRLFTNVSIINRRASHVGYNIARLLHSPSWHGQGHGHGRPHRGTSERGGKRRRDGCLYLESTVLSFFVIRLSAILCYRASRLVFVVGRCFLEIVDKGITSSSFGARARAHEHCA